MAYRWSEIDRKNAASFAKDASRRTLKSIELTLGSVRGLKGLKIEFTYPLAAIAGRNGSGKSTVLALAACAYHNNARSWRLSNRKTAYYTFSDFFVQAQGEVPVEGIAIRYGFFSDTWRPSDKNPEGRGVGYQHTSKNRGGRWSDYASRIRRPVAVFGIDRVVPPSEKSVLKNYRGMFSSSARSGIEDSARASVSRVLGIKYDDFEIRSHGSHSLSLVKCNGNSYSGFNMGAGEQALFGLFAAIHSAPKATLFLIDEIELGLHEAAQTHLLQELKQLAFEQSHQFIFTTHSATVLGALPPEARYLLEKRSGGTHVVEGVSPLFAAGRLSDRSRPELTIYVEDVSAREFVSAALTKDERSRVRIVEVGSHSAVVGQLAAKFVDGESAADSDVMAFLDGDQRSAEASHRSRFLGLVDQTQKERAGMWLADRLMFLPSSEMPERFVIGQLRESHIEAVAEKFRIADVEEARAAFDKALVRGDHSELYWIAEDFCVSEDVAWRDLCAVLRSEDPDAFEEAGAAVRSMLAAQA